MYLKNNNYIPFFIIAALSVLTSWMLYPSFMSDDAFIHAGFIDGLIKKGGFYFTRNLTYGTTAPLWTILCAIFIKLSSVSLATGIRIMSGIFNVLTILLFARLLMKEKIHPLLILCAALSLAFNSYVMRWYLSGMECGAAIFFLVLAFYYFRRPNNNVNAIVLGLSLGCASLIRPEILLFFICFSIWKLFLHYGQKMSLLLYFISGVLPLAAWNIFAYFHFGTITPNSFIVKANKSLFTFSFSHLPRTVKLILSGNLPEFLLLFTLFLIILLYCFQKKKVDFTFLKRADITLVVACFLGFYGYYIAKDVIVISRYSIILFPFIIYFTAISMDRIIAESKTKNILAGSWITVILIYSAIFSLMVIKPSSDQFSSGFQKVYKEMAAILSNMPQGSTVGLTDVGIIGTYSGLDVRDFAGLVDHTRFDYKTTKDYIAAKKPNFIILRGEGKINAILPKDISHSLLFQKNIPTLGINEGQNRYARLWQVNWP